MTLTDPRPLTVLPRGTSAPDPGVDRRSPLRWSTPAGREATVPRHEGAVAPAPRRGGGLVAVLAVAAGAAVVAAVGGGALGARMAAEDDARRMTGATSSASPAAPAATAQTSAAP